MERLTEWKPHRLSLTAAERRELLGLTKRGTSADEPVVIEVLQPTEVDGEYTVVPGPFVGRFALRSGLVLDIRSRVIPDYEIVDVLRLSGRLPIRIDDAPTPGEHGWGIVDILALALAREAERIISQGLAKGYEQRRFRAPPLPGSVDVREHLSRHGARPDKLVTVARRLTSDITRNQALVAATTILLRLPLQTAARTQLRRVASALSHVSAQPVSPVQLDRLIGEHRQTRYDTVLRLCAMVLRGGRVASAGDRYNAASVLFAMPRVWEDFVAAWVRRQHPDREVDTQFSFPLFTDRSSPTVSADIVVHGEPIELFDAKYKKRYTEAGATPSADDVYQMATYCQRLGADTATLVFPGVGPPRAFQIADRRIIMQPLNVGMF